MQKTSSTSLGLRFNNGKLRWSLVDFESLAPMVRVLEFGAIKYDDHNWKKGLKVTGVIESLLRHVFALLHGEDNDQESGLPHVGHIQCNAMFLAYMLKRKPELDNRYKPQPNGSNESTLVPVPGASASGDSTTESGGPDQSSDV